jgi:hypothetical protein
MNKQVFSKRKLFLYDLSKCVILKQRVISMDELIYLRNLRSCKQKNSSQFAEKNLPVCD